MQYGKKISKKKTSFKKPDRSPIFNEAMIFSVPSQNLQVAIFFVILHFIPIIHSIFSYQTYSFIFKTIQLRLTISEMHSEDYIKPIGHVIVGAQGSGRSLNHWKQMLVTLRKPVAMWHPLRK